MVDEDTNFRAVTTFFSETEGESSSPIQANTATARSAVLTKCDVPLLVDELNNGGEEGVIALPGLLAL